MKEHLNILRITRQNYLQQLEGISLELLNKIPDGFSNNLIWNAAHAVVTQQLLCYGLSGQKLYLPAPVVDAYRKGSRPEKPATQEEVEQIFNWLTASVDWLEEDLANARFKEFKTYPTSFGVTLNSIEEAVIFNNCHEAMHYGYNIALKKHLKI